MLPDKNELNDELTEQISGGGLSDAKAIQEMKEDYEPQVIPKITPVSDIKTTVPIPSDKKKLIKVH